MDWTKKLELWQKCHKICDKNITQSAYLISIPSLLSSNNFLSMPTPLDYPKVASWELEFGALGQRRASIASSQWRLGQFGS